MVESELRCTCNKLLGKTDSESIISCISALESNNVSKPYIVKLWCARCKKEVLFKL